MKVLEVLHTGNTKTLLTITPSRITIKFRDGLTKEQEDRIQTFFMKIAEQLKDEPLSRRGTLQELHSFISMKLNSGAGITFREEELQK